MGHFEEHVVNHEMEEILEEQAPKKRYGLREYSSENGPLVHRTVSGTSEKHFDLKTSSFKVIQTPSQIAKDAEMLHEAEAVLEGADLG